MDEIKSILLSLKKAIEFHLEGLKRKKLPISQSSTEVVVTDSVKKI